MSLRFDGGYRLQRGRGIGGLFRLAKSLFMPVVKSISKAAASKKGRNILKAVKKQAIKSSGNVIGDIIKGENLGESVKKEVKSVKKKSGKFFNNLIEEDKKKVKKPVKRKQSNKVKLYVKKRKRDLLDG